MSHLLSWLTDHVRNAVEKCGATGASVYVPTPWNATAPGLLVHVGTGTPLPEMATLDDARAFAGATGARLGASEDPRTLTTVVVPSALAEGCLLPIPLLATLWNRGSPTATTSLDAKEQLRRLSDRLGGPPIVGWLGLRFDHTAAQSPSAQGWRSLLELASSLASTYVCFYGILTDPITGLPGRAELNGTLRAELDRAHTNGLPFSLVFLKLRHLDAINERHGRQAGDTALREFLEVVHRTLRRSDTVMRYGGSVFALPLRDVRADGAMVVGRKLLQRIAEFAFLNGTVTLPCAVGVASCEGTEEPPLRPLDLLRRADQALSASERDGGRDVVLWQADGEVATVEHLDPLLGVFTGQSEKDYRNMRLLWDVLQALSSASGSQLAQAVVARLFALFSTTRAALFEPNSEGKLGVMAGLQRTDAGASADWSAAEVRPEEWQLNEEALATCDAKQREWLRPGPDGAEVQHVGLAVPLVIDGRALGTLYLSGHGESLGLDANDAPVFGGVAAQLALALDRERLTEQQRLREHRERQVLRAELDRLRSVLSHTEFVFRSQAMTDLLATTRRVATTDATVLITGESGTGKEMLAHTLHELSPRKKSPLVIVDCGAIPASLMDSELFGRERGAFTGAERRAGGRLAQADGGTVFLDEIGELPLEVQAKLLRFVQEKTITMVGGTRSQKVDVRIIAATNRALEHEVRAGRFRGDLFHRLNVVRLRVPPLRERPDDVLFLARHFLEGFARQYAKPITGLGADAARRLEEYPWPGNVRELQNTILQAVVLAEGPVLRSGDLQLQDADLALYAEVPPREFEASPGQAGARPQLPARRPSTEAPLYAEARQRLVDCLRDEIAAARSSGARMAPPLGKWLARDLVLEAFEQSGRVAARAALSLQLPETTFSRRLRQAEGELDTVRVPGSWTAVRSSLTDWLRSSGRPDGNVVDQADDLLLGLILDQVPDVAQAACLMGVTVPTMKRRLGEFRRDGGASTGAVLHTVGSFKD